MKTRFIYLATLDFGNVFKTQIISWLNLYRQNGIDFSLIRIYDIRKLLRFNKVTDENNKIRNLFPFVLYNRWFIPGKNIVSRILSFLFVTIQFLSILFSRKKTVFQTRSPQFWREFKFLKTLFGNRCIVIFDSRAAAAEELKYQHKHHLTNHMIKRIKNTGEDEKQMNIVSDKVFCVSNHLIAYHLEQNPQLTPAKMVYYPCSADSKYFFYSSEERQIMRNKLGLNDKIIIVYSGSLDLPWHMAEEIFGFFKLLNQQNSGTFLLVLSYETEIAGKLSLKCELTENNYLCKAIENNEIRKYLNAADAGIIMREDVPMNQVASPTKFAEYQLCGLPAILTPGVGDFSDFVVRHQTGGCYNLLHPDESILCQVTSDLKSWFNNENLRKTISETGYNHFSKQIVLNHILEIYSSFK